MNIKVKKLRPNAQVPKKSNEFAGAYDLFISDYTLYEYGIEIKTGIALEIPNGYRGIIVPRSSISKTPLLLHNSQGVIDSDYRGELLIKLALFGDMPELNRGDRIAQIYFEKVLDVFFIDAVNLSESDRGHGGFGSTGK